MTWTLHGYFRSSASWRVRIALNLKGVTYSQVCYPLRTKAHRSAEYLGLNPQGLVPALAIDGDHILTQSLAICEYLDETLAGPALLPADPLERARVRAFAQIIACDIHPVQNLKVLNDLRALGASEDQVNGWARKVIEDGLDACEGALTSGAHGLDFCFGNQPGLAEICLIPQLGNARRFGADMRWPQLLEVDARCAALSPFKAALPENQPDAE